MGLSFAYLNRHVCVCVCVHIALQRFSLRESQMRSLISDLHLKRNLVARRVARGQITTRAQNFREYNCCPDNAIALSG